MMNTLLISIVFLLGKPPVPKSDPLPPITPEMWKTSSLRLKTIGLALHNYHDAHGHFPKDLTDEKGKKLLSWRVVLLPYMGQEALFEKFKRDEAWDSPHNAKLIEMMPETYTPVRVKPAKGQTYFQGFDGPATLFESKKETKIASVVDGCSLTAMLVESATPTTWTKPSDITFTADGDFPKLGGVFDGAFTCLLVDGSTVRVRKDANPSTLRALIGINDGKTLDLNSITLPEGK